MSLRLTGRRQSATIMAQNLTEGFLTIAQASSPGELRNVTPTITEIAEGRVGRTIIQSRSGHQSAHWQTWPELKPSFGASSCPKV